MDVSSWVQVNGVCTWLPWYLSVGEQIKSNISCLLGKDYIYVITAQRILAKLKIRNKLNIFTEMDYICTCI